MTPQTQVSPSTDPADPNGPTGRLCKWINSVKLSDVPEHIRTRAKYLMLDGIGCRLVGAHLPWSETAAGAIIDMEGEGKCRVWGWEKTLPPLPAALVNSTFVQSFELDDWHSEAPLHSNSILLPALFSAMQQSSTPVTGEALLLSTIVGYETGPRIGLALHGAEMLTSGWHSGAIFGPPASAAAVSKLLSLSASQIEDALGIACTQAGGLMSAQFESMVKRMQHGFAARNGLFAALLAKDGYAGIKRVFEREYGGYLSCFSKGLGQEPPYLVDELSRDLGTTWQTESIRVKQHAAMAAIHCTIECIAALQKEQPEQFENPRKIKSMQIYMGEAAYHHGGWEAKRPLTVTGAQMSVTYCAATQLIDRQVLPAQFNTSNLDRDEVWDMQKRFVCKLYPDYGGLYKTRVTVELANGHILEKEMAAPKSVIPGLSNEEVVEKWRAITANVINVERRRRIEDLVLNLEKLEDLGALMQLLDGKTANPIAS